MISVKQIEKAAQSDEELMISFKQTGNQSVLAKLYLRYSELVYGTCMKYLKIEEDAKDAAVNIYQELLIKLPSQNINNFKSWLYVVTKNHCLMQLRKFKKNITVEFDASIMQSEDFSHLDSELEKENKLVKLEDCLKILPVLQQQSIQLFYLQGKCYNEIATETGLEWNKIRSLIQNGRRNLKICMEKNG